MSKASFVDPVYVFGNNLWPVHRCEAEVQTDTAEGMLEQGPGRAAQTGMVVELQEQVGKLKAELRKSFTVC